MKHFFPSHRSTHRTRSKNGLKKEEVEDLVQHAQEGDIRAFEALYEEYFNRMYRFIYSRIGTHDDAQDVVSETWKVVWLNLKKYRRGNFQGYLFRIAYTQLITFVRKKKHNESIEDYPAIPSKKISIEEKLAKDDDAKRLYDALLLLPKQYAQIIALRFIDGFSIKETAQVLQKSSVMIRVTQHRAMKKLKSILKNV